MTKAYCVKCASVVDLKDPKQITVISGTQPATQGTCPKCGITIVNLGKA